MRSLCNDCATASRVAYRLAYRLAYRPLKISHSFACPDQGRAPEQRNQIFLQCPSLLAAQAGCRRARIKGRTAHGHECQCPGLQLRQPLKAGEAGLEARQIAAGVQQIAVVPCQKSAMNHHQTKIMPSVRKSLKRPSVTCKHSSAWRHLGATSILSWQNFRAQHAASRHLTGGGCPSVAADDTGHPRCSPSSRPPRWPHHRIRMLCIRLPMKPQRPLLLKGIDLHRAPAVEAMQRAAIAHPRCNAAPERVHLRLCPPLPPEPAQHWHPAPVRQKGQSSCTFVAGYK